MRPVFSPRSWKTLCSGIAFVLPLMILAGCGGGGNSSPTPPATSVPTATTTARQTGTPQATRTASSPVNSTPTPFPTRTATPRPTATSKPTPTPSPNRTRIACVGDSITFGQGVSNPNINSYPAVLGQKLGDTYEVRRFGVPGATALNNSLIPYQAQPAFTQALDYKPDIVIVGLGTNDGLVPLTDAQTGEFVTDYKSLIAKFKQANTRAKVFVCLPPPSYPQTRVPNLTLTSTILPLVKQVAQDTKAKIIDFNTPLRDQPQLYYDGYHPNIQGAQLLASIAANNIIRP